MSKGKMTPKSLYQSERVWNYASLTPGQQSSVRGCVTWLSKRAYEGGEDAEYLRCICQAIGMEMPKLPSAEEAAELYAHPVVRQVMKPVYKLMMVKDGSIAAPCGQVRMPSDVSALVMTYSAGLDREHLIVILLSTKNDVIGINTVSVGGLNCAYVPMREVFKPALLANAAAIIVAHNHPSGDPTPSPEDVMVTRKIVEAGNLLDIKVLDHLICGESRWVSLKERGLGF